MLQKILLNRDFVPNNQFDWSLNQNENNSGNQNIRNEKPRVSDISSCEIPDEMQPWKENIHPHDRQKNIKKIKENYSTETRPAEYLMKSASNTEKGQGKKYFAYTNNHI